MSDIFFQGDRKFFWVGEALLVQTAIVFRKIVVMFFFLQRYSSQCFVET